MKKENHNRGLTRYIKRDYHKAMTDKFGVRYRRYRKSWDELIPPFPLQIDLELNDRCNSRCPICLRSSDMETLNTNVIMSEKTFRKIIDEGGVNNLNAIGIGAGDEPLLHPELPSFVKYARYKGVMDIRITTNGILLTKELSKQLINSGITYMSVSLDATESKVYKKKRNNDSYDIIVKNIDDFLETRGDQVLPVFRLSYVVWDDENLKEEFIRQWIDKVDYIDFQQYIGYTRIQAYRERYFCADPFRRVWIRANGDVFPCCRFFCIYPEYIEEARVGNIHSDTITDIWNNSKIGSIRQRMLKKDYPSFCLKCQESQRVKTKC